MKDGNFIPALKKILYICSEENLMQFETVDDTDQKIIFWTSDKEVDFIEEKEENWDEEQIQRHLDIISDKWLTI